MSRLFFRIALMLAICVPFSLAAPQTGVTSTTPILNAAEAGKILPSSVFFRGQSATVQARNSTGVRFAKDSFMLVALVDNSGYSSDVQQKYQAYLITEEPITLGGHRLTPGAYGCGFIAGGKFIVMDIGGHDLFTVSSTRDAALHRPTPLQILPDGNHYRLYAGRNFVELTAPAQ